MAEGLDISCVPSTQLAVGTALSRSEAQGPWILLVDDHEPCLRLLCEVVESAGYRCQVARSAIEALSRCEGHRPGAVVTDLAMPGLGGDGLAGRLKLLDPGLPIVLVTGQDLDEPTRDRLRGAFAEILLKPVDPERLLARLGQLLEPSAAVPGRARDSLP